MYTTAVEYEMIEKNVAEEYVIERNGNLRSLLPGERNTGEGVCLKLLRKRRVEGVAGAGRIAMKGSHMAGGWCRFSCRLEVPRRFAMREGRRLADGVQAEQILCEVLRGALADAFSDVQLDEHLSQAQVKKRIEKQICKGAERDLLRVGWQLTECKLEDIQIT